ncbi:Gastric triacylglycerol lipase-like [Balamuthia mandrillaris]
MSWREEGVVHGIGLGGFLLLLLLLVGSTAAGEPFKAEPRVPVLGVASLPKNVTELIRGYGYPCEDYEVLTPDGYFLSMQRIPYGRHANRTGNKGVVFFQHGLTDNAIGVTLNGPDEALAFILADNGYDVWLGNNRGNGYSMSNTKYTPAQAAFWEFSFDEMGTYDLPTQINFALNVSKAKKLAYIGHSEGTIQAFAGFSSDQELAQKVTIFIALAPVAYVYHIKSPILVLLAELDTDEILEAFGDHEFYLSDAIKKLMPNICTFYPPLCHYVVTLLSGPSTNINMSRVPYYLNYEPNPTSVINMAHWAQMIRHNKFQKFDWGRLGNLLHYGQPFPPSYNLSALLQPPIALFTGSNDYLADPEDVLRLLSELPRETLVDFHNEPDYAHLDFILGMDARTRIFPKVLDLLKKYAPPPPSVSKKNK